MDKCIIKITRKIPISWINGGTEETHYYKDSNTGNKSYIVANNTANSTKFDKQEAGKTIKEIKHMYNENLNNGILLKIEALDSETLNPITLEKIKYTKYNRFEIMDI